MIVALIFAAATAATPPAVPPMPVPPIEQRGPDRWPLRPAAITRPQLMPPPIIGSSCAAYMRAVRAVQAKIPDGAPLPQGFAIACKNGKVVSYGSPLRQAEFDRMPNLYHQPSRCGPVGDEITRRIETATRGKRMAAEYAVMRQVDGCGVASPVGYHPNYLTPGAADPQSAKPAGEPARKR